MASSLFPQHSQVPQNNRTSQAFNVYNQVKQLAGGNPEALFNMMFNSNPQFKQFVLNNQGKTPQQIARENGIDINQLQSMIGDNNGRQ